MSANNSTSFLDKGRCDHPDSRRLIDHVNQLLFYFDTLLEYVGTFTRSCLVKLAIS